MSKAITIPFDYDSDPDRFRTNVDSIDKYSMTQDIHELVAEWLASQHCSPILDIGCGEGRFIQFAQGQNLPVVALDKSATMLQAITAPCVLADANHLPFRDCYFHAVVALYMLYHLSEPRKALLESQRVLKPEGLFIACVPSRFNDPELVSVLPQAAMTFDAENGPEITGEYFDIIKVERWDAPLVHLPDKKALAQYLRGRGVSHADVQKALSSIPLPLNITKRGALIYGRRNN